MENKIENIKIPIAEVEFSPLTIDEIGTVFMWKNKVFRAINKETVEYVKEMISSGLIDELAQQKLFPKTWITSYELDGYGLVIQHEKINVVAYPYEWSFSMLKDAAIIILKINQISFKYGYQTKDCHGWNVIFDSMIPKFIDLGSFKKMSADGTGWVAYEQFLDAYYYPLKLWSQGGNYFARATFLSYQLPNVYDFLFLNPILRLFGINFLKKITNNFFRYKQIGNVTSQKLIERFSHIGLGKLVSWLRNKKLLPFVRINYSHLLKKIEKIQDKSLRTKWGKYQNEYVDVSSEVHLSERFKRIIEIIKTINIKSVVELGGNQGIFSEALVKNTTVEQVICTDYDEKAIDSLYNRLKNNGLKITPVMLDVTSPNHVAFDVKPEKRFLSDLVVMLAVTHHLTLSQNVNLELIMKILSQYTKKYVLVEFMPLGLYSGDDKNIPSVPTWYNEDWFRNNFEKYFTLIIKEQVEKNRILFFGELL